MKRILAALLLTLAGAGIFYAGLARLASAAGQTAASAPADEGIWAVTASVNGKDPAAMGKEVGQKIKEACKGRKPDLILVFDCAWKGIKTVEDKKAAIDGLAESLDKKLIYGLTSHGSVFTETSKGSGDSLAVMAMGGVKITASQVTPEKDKEEAAYATLAEAMKTPYTDAAGKGRLILLFGSCLPAADGQKIVDAFVKTIGKEAPIFGSVTTSAIASPEWCEFSQGEVLKNSVVAVLVTGDFACSFSMAEASPVDPKKRNEQDPDKVIESTQKAAKAALGDKKDDVAVTLVETSFTRFHSLLKIKSSGKEMKTLVEMLPAPIIGLGGEGEVGKPSADEPPVAKIDQIGICVIRKTAPVKK